jgi:tRNA(Ile)-lysidine synthase
LLRQANPNVSGALSRLATTMAEQDDYLEQTVGRLLEQHVVVTPGRIWIPRDIFVAWHPAIRSRVLLTAVAALDPDAEPDFAGIAAVSALLDSAEGGTAELGQDMTVSADSGWLSLIQKGAPWAPPYPGYWIDDAGKLLPASMTTETGLGDEDAPSLTVRVPRGATATIRARRDGDRVYPTSLKGRSQKLKDWLINRKIPRRLRDHLPVIEAGGQIVALWDSRQWQTFVPPLTEDTIEIGLISILENT